MLSGPDLLNSLIGVLLRHRISVVADVEAMFCQVRLKNEDTDANRFLWRDDPNSYEPPDHYKLLVHIFGLTDSPCAATYALQRAARNQANEFPPKVIEANSTSMIGSIHTVITLQLKKSTRMLLLALTIKDLT